MTHQHRGSRAEGGAETMRVDTPEVVLPAVDERHRYLVGEALLQYRVGVDVDLHEGLPQLGTDGCDDGPRLVAEVAARASVESDARRG